MAVSAQNTRIKYDGDGATDTFSIAFALPADSDGSDVKVYIVDDEKAITLLGSNYSVDTVAMTVTYPTVGGVAPLDPGVNFLPTGWQIVIRRVEALAQNLNLPGQGLLSLPAIEAAMDYLMYKCQELQEQLNRVPLAPVSVAANITPSISGIPVYADNAAAIAGGLLEGQFYRTGADPDPVCVVHAAP